MTQEHLLFVTEKPLKLILKYAFPAVISLTISGLQSMIDGIFVGNLINSSALASVNIASPFLQLIVGISLIASVGTQSQVGIYFGCGKRKEGEDTFQTLLRTLCLLALLMSFIGFFCNKSIATILGADTVLLENSALYIRVLSLFALPLSLMFYFGFLNRILGNPQFYFYGALMSIVMNICLNYIFLAKLDLGIMGAALATGISYITSFCIVALPFFRKNNGLTIKSGHFNKKAILPVLGNGASEGVNELSAAITLFLFNNVLMELAGAEGVAAFTAINYVGAFGILLLFGISDGIGPIVSYNYGAGKSNRVKKIMTLAATGNFILGFILFLILSLFSTQLIQLFIKDNIELTHFAANGAKIYAFAFLFSGFNILASGYFTFIGRGLESAIIAASRGFVFITTGIILLPRMFEINGIWMSVPFAECLTLLIVIWLLQKNKNNVFNNNL